MRSDSPEHALLEFATRHIPLRQRRAKSFLKLARRCYASLVAHFRADARKRMLPVVKENRPRKQAINTELRHSVQQAKCLYSPGLCAKGGIQSFKAYDAGVLPPAVLLIIIIIIIIIIIRLSSRRKKERRRKNMESRNR